MEGEGGQKLFKNCMTSFKDDHYNAPDNCVFILVTLDKENGKNASQEKSCIIKKILAIKYNLSYL